MWVSKKREWVSECGCGLVKKREWVSESKCGLPSVGVV